MKQWTAERIMELVPEDPDTIGAWLKSHIPAHRKMAGLLLQTREELETARKDMVDGAMKFDDKVIECAHFRAALERISSIEDRYEGADWEEIEEARDIAREALTPKGANDER